MNTLLPAVRSASALLAALAWTGLVLATSPAAAAPTAPQLSIAVDDGHATAKAKDKLTYTVTVTILGTKAVSGVRLSQTVPPGSRFVSADAGAHHRGDRHRELAAQGRANRQSDTAHHLRGGRHHTPGPAPAGPRGV